MRLLALIPAYNESAAIAQVVTETQRHLPVLVVDDGSNNNTASLAEAAGATVLVQNPNRGKGAALRRGFVYALENGFAGVISLDGDGQHDPAEIPAFVTLFEEKHSDLIIGYRSFKEMPFWRWLGNNLGFAIFSWAMGTRILDNQSGYRLVSKRLTARLLAGQESGYEFEMEQIVSCVEAGYRLAWTPIRTIYKGEPSHIRPIPHIINFMRVAWQTKMRLWRTGKDQNVSAQSRGET
jgi:glycosyltransferase involved in cell wall biosynthesis